MGKIKGWLNQAKLYWNHPAAGRFLTIKETGSFCFYALGTSFIITAINYVVTITELPLLFRIDAIHGYLICLCGNVLNMILQPLLGYFMEKTNTKRGRYKPFILFSLPLIIVFGILATFLPQFDEKGRLIFAYCTCIPVISLTTYANNMYQAMPNIITPNSQERADIMTPIGLLVGLAPFILQIVAGPIRSAFLAQNKEYLGLRIIGMVSIIIGVACCLFIIKVKERVYVVDNQKEEKIGFFESIKLLAHNKALLILFIALVLGSLREFWKIFILVIMRFRFASTVTTALDISGIPLTIIGFASTVAMLLLPILTRKLDKKKIIIIFSAINIASLVTLVAIGFENLAVGTTSAVVITLLLFLASVSPTYLLIPLLLGDVADYQQLKTGKRMEGFLQNFVFTIPLLLSQCFMLGAAFWQKSIGFEQKDYSGLEVITDSLQSVGCEWFNAICIISAVSCALLMIVMFFYPITKKKHNEILESLKEQSKECAWTSDVAAK